MNIAVGSDHAGFNLKQVITSFLAELGHSYSDFGCYDSESVDYPDIAAKVAEEVSAGNFDRGILICGSGQGMCVAANKVPGIRATLCHDLTSAHFARAHNDANVLCLGERIIPPDLAREIVKTWLEADFEGGRHERRIGKIGEIEERHRQYR